MTVIFDASVPATERRWIGRLIRRAARMWGCELYEYRVSATLRGTTYGSCLVTVKSMATLVEVKLNQARFAERAACRVDLVHELLHVLDGEVRYALLDLAAHVPDERRRRRAFRRADRRFEAWHDRLARCWAAVLA